MISTCKGLRRLASPVLLVVGAMVLLMAGYWGDVTRRARHSVIAYQVLRASQAEPRLDPAALIPLTAGQATWDARTLWLMGRYNVSFGWWAQALDALTEASRLLPADYQVHRDLLYAYDGAGEFRKFAREYQRGASVRDAVRAEVASSGGPVAYAETLARGGFDIANPRSREMVLANHIRLVDVSLGDAAREDTTPALQLLAEQFGEELLVRSRVVQACQLGWDLGSCSEVSPDDLTISRLRGWESASLTDLVADLCLRLHEEGQWSDADLVALGRYLVWQHGHQPVTERFLRDASARDLDGGAWARLIEEMAHRRDEAREGTAVVGDPDLTLSESNLLASPTSLFDREEAGYLSRGREEQAWGLRIYDARPNQEGGGYIGGEDAHVCPSGADALRIDGLSSAPGEANSNVWAGFQSNVFTLKAGFDYELTLVFVVWGSEAPARVSVEYAPAALFGPQRRFQLTMAEGEWSFEHKLRVEGATDTSGRVRIGYRGHGSLWLCDARLVCKNCDEAAATAARSFDGYPVQVSEPGP